MAVRSGYWKAERKVAELVDSMAASMDMKSAVA
jgi:hypothetical protein